MIGETMLCTEPNVVHLVPSSNTMADITAHTTPMSVTKSLSVARTYDCCTQAKCQSHEEAVPAFAANRAARTP